jgi:hypothetical protein
MISRWHLWYRFHLREQSGVALRQGLWEAIYWGYRRRLLPFATSRSAWSARASDRDGPLCMMVTPNIVMRAPTGLALLVFSWALAGCDDPRADCAKVQDNPAQSIQACTKIINAGGDTRHNLALAFFNRGAAFNNLGN